jgi:RNA polymerase sigma-70 factor (ECF subfamily)
LSSRQRDIEALTPDTPWEVRSRPVTSSTCEIAMTPFPNVGPVSRRLAGGSANVLAMIPSALAGALAPRLPRDNDAWVRELESDGPEGAAAQTDLRGVLVTGLVRALSSRGVAPDLCEDFAQEALVRIRDRLATFRGESRFTTWAMSLATRIAFDELRHKRWKDVSFDGASADAKTPLAFEARAEASQEKHMLREKVLAELRRVLENELTERQRAVLVAELNGMPHAEIATSLGMNRNALYKLSHDARKRVKAHLEGAGISEVDVLWVFE